MKGLGTVGFKSTFLGRVGPFPKLRVDLEEKPELEANPQKCYLTVSKYFSENDSALVLVLSIMEQSGEAAPRRRVSLELAPIFKLNIVLSSE